MQGKPSLKTVSDDELLRRLSEILNKSRGDEADLIEHLAEVDARRLYAREAAPSMFAYCTEVLHLSEAEAWLRIRVARASRKHSMLLPMLRDGRLHVSGIVVLAPHLTPDNRTTLLNRAVHKTRRQIEEIVAEVAPREDVPGVMRKLPTRRGPDVPAAAGPLTPGTVGGPGHQLTPDTVGDSVAQLTPESVAEPDARLCRGAVGVRRSGQRPDTVATRVSPDAIARPSSASSSQVRPPRIEPLAPARYRVEFTADAELRDMLERLQALMRSSETGGELAAVVKVAVAEKLERLEAKRFAKTKSPRTSLAQTDTSPRARRIPAAVRRAVHERDGGRCTYRNTHGRRCTHRHDLEFHHRRPFGCGGEHSPDNVALMCRAHNELMAEHDHGEGVMARFRRSASRVSEGTGACSTMPTPSTSRRPSAGHRRGNAAHVPGSALPP